MVVREALAHSPAQHAIAAASSVVIVLQMRRRRKDPGCGIHGNAQKQQLPVAM